MKNLKIGLLTLILLSVGLVGCKKEDDPEIVPKTEEATIIGTWTRNSSELTFDSQNLTWIIKDTMIQYYSYSVTSDTLALTGIYYIFIPNNDSNALNSFQKMHIKVYNDSLVIQNKSYYKKQ